MSEPVRAAQPACEDLLAPVRELTAAHLNLSDVVRWLATRRGRGVATRPVVHVQDEYTHDVVVPYDQRHYLAYDVT